jgi:CheY-like chemotaxis protein
LEDGVQKAFSGYTTIEAVVAVVRTLPPGWETAYEKRSEKALVIGDPLPDPFNATPKESAVILERGSGVFRQPTSEVQSPKRQRPLILVAEDDGDQRDILEMVIKEARYDVISAKDGADALAKIQKELPDLIITDLMMPRMDGRELVAHVKANPRLNKIPVMVLTVVSDVEKEYALLNCGAEEYCEKTVQRRILLKRVENLLKRFAGKGAAV